MTSVEVRYVNIPGFPGYRVGDDGSVWSCLERVTLGGGRGFRSFLGTDWRKLNPVRQTYWKVNLHKDGKKHMKCVNVLVLMSFVGPKPKGFVCCHNDGNPLNNVLSNLRWDTYQSNIDDKKKHGTVSYGSKNGRSVLTEDIVRNVIRSFLTEESFTIRGTARKYKVTSPTIRQIVLKRRWLHVWKEFDVQP